MFTREELQEIIDADSETAEKITLILNRHHAEISNVKDHSPDKERAENLEAQLKEAQKTLNALKKNNQDNEALQAEITKVQEKNKELQATLKESRITSSIEMAAVRFGAKNPEHVAKLIDRSQCGIDKEDNVYGIDEQFQALKENDGSYLFNVQAQEVSERPAYEPNRGTAQQAVQLGANRALEIGRLRAQRKQET